MPYFSVVQEAAALGCAIDWGSDDGMPSQKGTLYESPDGFAMPEDFLARPPIATVIDAVKKLKKRFGDQVYIMGKVMGPWTLSYHLHGIEDFLIETLTEPKTVHAFLDRFKEVTTTFMRAQFEAGADAVTIADHITRDLASPHAYSEYLIGVHKEIIAGFPGKTILLHCCGNTLDRIGLFSQAGFNAFHFDSKNAIHEAMAASDSMKLTGCVDNQDVLLRGGSEDVRRQVLEIVQSGIRLVSPECAVPLGVKNENLAEIVKTVVEYGVGSA